MEREGADAGQERGIQGRPWQLGGLEDDVRQAAEAVTALLGEPS